MCQVESIIEYDSRCDVRQARRRIEIGTSGQGSGRRETILDQSSLVIVIYTNGPVCCATSTRRRNIFRTSCRLYVYPENTRSYYCLETTTVIILCTERFIYTYISM